MPIDDPVNVIAEILGEPAAQMRNPVNADYLCPFLDSKCVKSSHAISGPYPVCTIFHGGRSARTVRQPICVCPNRFHGIVDLVGDIRQHCWPPGPPPENIRVAYEVKMAKFGNVDMVVADISQTTGEILNFVSVELQAVDTTGSYVSAYEGVLNSQSLVKFKFDINWKNVEKRFIRQLIEKGFYHHHWGTRIVAVVQTPLYDRLHQAIGFDELAPDRGGNTVIFMLYDYRPDPTRPGGLYLAFDRAVGTSHNSLMSSSIYQQVPSKEVFHKRIMANLAR